MHFWWEYARNFMIFPYPTIRSMFLDIAAHYITVNYIYRLQLKKKGRNCPKKGKKKIVDLFIYLFIHAS